MRSKLIERRAIDSAVRLVHAIIHRASQVYCRVWNIGYGTCYDDGRAIDDKLLATWLPDEVVQKKKKKKKWITILRDSAVTVMIPRIPFQETTDPILVYSGGRE